ncbi:LysM peptidoglycan-binding domain-containing protein [Bosea sp. (in: a-proteobacteria)]|uniref:LysM peptidoglycan-binding domain-containing protein n=1 Tax=Bosea sp. (in: a-proteobacteria) TaxID=1871050 RepID=UPI002733DD4D|nr:LysM peptidoglycan-binding domain-containing protein [Bosea sp. (in: a-proteobacteria)]MDP3410078.1 LysM peptidoglycan-binding domain-containing protein [Bosea sp. (in: a-proteobacteria)]
MALKIATPKPTLPRDYRPPGGRPYRVQLGDNWGSIADKHHVPVMDLIRFNFRTTKPEEINYYLRHNVGCTEVSPDGKNYSFRNASPGIIYLLPDFAYATPPLDPRLVTLIVLPSAGFTLKDLPTNPLGWISCKAHFDINVYFDSSIADVMPYQYRQYIKGRVRIRTSASPVWFDVTPIKVPVPGSPAINALNRPINRHTFLEDGRFDGLGRVLRYGYRVAPPFHHPEVDLYENPTVIAPPQTGYTYRATDDPGIEIEKVYINSSGNPESMNGISIELDFRGDVVEVRDHVATVIKSKSWRFAGHFNIRSRNPLMYDLIGPP